MLIYVYDENGAPAGIKYRTSSYAEGVFDYFFFEKNLQGDIVAIYNASGVVQNKYYYDDLGQLIREDNRALNKTYVWSYDDAGNILSKKTYAFTVSLQRRRQLCLVATSASFRLMTFPINLIERDFTPPKAST